MQNYLFGIIMAVILLLAGILLVIKAQNIAIYQIKLMDKLPYMYYLIGDRISYMMQIYRSTRFVGLILVILGLVILIISIHK